MKNIIDLENKICLEIGPGNSYLMAYNCLMNGARKVFLLDKYPRYIKSKKQKDFLIRELDFTQRKYNRPLFFIKNGKLNEDYIEFIKGDIHKLAFNPKVDFIYSISVLEHIKEIEQAISALTNNLKNNGLMYHCIDMRDHYNFAKPFLFYKYSQKVWEKYLTREGVSYTNRFRYDDYHKLFRKNNLKILNENLIKIDHSYNMKIHRSFSNKSQDMLNIWKMNVLLQKQNDRSLY